MPVENCLRFLCHLLRVVLLSLPFLFHPRWYSLTLSYQIPALVPTYPPPPLQITYPTSNPQTIHLHHKSQESSQQGTNFPTFRTVHTNTRGSNLNFKNKRQKREYYHHVNHVAVEAQSCEPNGHTCQ
jgi:hypothetical protein